MFWLNRVRTVLELDDDDESHLFPTREQNVSTSDVSTGVTARPWVLPRRPLRRDERDGRSTSREGKCRQYSSLTFPRDHFDAKSQYNHVDPPWGTEVFWGTWEYPLRSGVVRRRLQTHGYLETLTPPVPLYGVFTKSVTSSACNLEDWVVQLKVCVRCEGYPSPVPCP